MIQEKKTYSIPTKNKADIPTFFESFKRKFQIARWANNTINTSETVFNAAAAMYTFRGVKHWKFFVPTSHDFAIGWHENRTDMVVQR